MGGQAGTCHSGLWRSSDRSPSSSAPAIDLPTKLWLEEIARHAKPLDEKQQAEFEKHLDAWSAYLMGMYAEVYGVFSANLRSLSPSLRCTASVQVDHTAVRFGQYFPQAYAPLDFQYQSTWNDQVGGPDYTYQWLLTQSLLEMHRGSRPTWISSALAAAHGRAAYPGKFMRVAAHGLAHGATGLGFACEAFSNILGGMNNDTNWENMKGKSGAADLVAGRDFLERFAALAIEGQGAHPVGILFSRSQFARQHVVMGYGVPQYKALVALTRLGYSPGFVTEEDLQAGRTRGLKALVVLGQTFPLPPAATAALAEFAKAGGRILVDGNTTEKLPAAEPLGVTFSFTELGKPHNWAAPNIVAGDNDTLLYERWHADLAPALAKALGPTGRGIFASDAGSAATMSLMQIDGGQATYVIAVNDSHVATQADWHAVRENLVPPGAAPPEAVVYDCTDEKPLGKLAAMDCDLSATTARVFAVLPKALNRIDLSASQRVPARGDVVLRVGFRDDAGQAVRAALDGNLIGTTGRAGSVELGIQPDAQRAEAPHARLARHEIRVSRVLHRALAHLERERRVAMVVEVHRGARVEGLNVRCQDLLETFAGAVTELQHVVPHGVPCHPLRHGMAELLLELRAASVAPAAVGRAEALVEHVDVESIDAVGQLLGNDLLHGVEIPGVQAEAADGSVVHATHFPLGMCLEEMPALLHDAVGDDRQIVLASLVHRLAQRVTRAKPGSLGQRLRVIVGVIAVAHPEHQVLAVCGDGAAHNLASIEARAVSRVVRVAMAELRARRADLHADEVAFEPRLLGGMGEQRDAKQRGETEEKFQFHAR
jgi:hypothetical protein